ncbi:MAG: M23 family metallopeptidase [Marinilabiliales bacterium]|nr:M23 family metallopeptidase [Marinilabiliales bacterium]
MNNLIKVEKIILIIFIGFCCCTPKRNVASVNGLKNDTIQIADTTINVLFQSDSIRKYSFKDEKFFTYTEPSLVAANWILPFNLPDRSDLNMISIISGFGTYRSGHVMGHRHSGIDIIPIGTKDTVFVYPISNGKVCLIRPTSPNKTVIIKHKLENGTGIYGSYIHLKDFFVENGGGGEPKHQNWNTIYKR